MCDSRGLNDPVIPEVKELVVTSECWLLGVDSVSSSTLGVISKKARSITLSLSTDFINSILLILSNGWGRGYLGSKSTLELSSDPTAEGRLVSRDRGSAGINLPGMWMSFMLKREKFSSHLFTQGATFSSALMVSQWMTVELSDLTVKGPWCRNLLNFFNP